MKQFLDETITTEKAYEIVCTQAKDSKMRNAWYARAWVSCHCHYGRVELENGYSLIMDPEEWNVFHLHAPWDEFYSTLME